MKFSRKSSKITNTISISKNLNENIARIKSELGNPGDLSVDISQLGSNQDLYYATLYIQNLVDITRINTLSMEVSGIILSDNKEKPSTPDIYFHRIKNTLSSFRASQEGSDYDALYSQLLSGCTIFLLDGYSKFFSIDTYGIEGRNIQEPTTQTVIKGPKEGFTEKITLNIALLRKRIKNKDLRVEELTLGTVTNTKIAVVYIDKIAKNEIVNEIKERLRKIKIDNLAGSSYIEELIKDDKYTIFPTLFNSERPDTITAGLVEGRVAILVDGTPFVLTAPALLSEFIQASEDYYNNFIVSSLIRLIRISAFFIALITPSLFVALLTFNQEAIPTPLLISIAAQREGLPFSTLIEALLMEITFEILKEAGIRMPRVIGPTIAIVGGLVLGQAAVNAGIVSSMMVIVVSITAIASYAISSYSLSNAIRTIRFCLMVLAGIFGLYGIFIGLTVLVLHLSKLKSIGVPYLAPFAPKIKGGYKDTLLRSPLWFNKLGPAGIRGIDTPRVNEEYPVNPQQKEKPELR